MRNTTHLCNLISLVAEAAKDAAHGDEKKVKEAARHLASTEIYGNVPSEVKMHIACVLAKILVK